jgi:hypothetical protein
MEIKAILQKPYTDNQRINFIVQYNHNLGYVIEETETELQALGYTEEEIDEQEKERIAHLTCTKRVFALMLQELGITYTMLKELIATNELAQLEWDLCVELERGNPLLDIMAYPLGITSEQLDGLFKYANGEITLEEFREIKEKPDVNNSLTTDEENSDVTGLESDEV